MVNEKKIVFIILIAERKKRGALLEALSKAGVRLTSTIYGKGTAEGNFLMNILGLVAEENKVVITCIATDSKGDEVFKLLVEDFNFNEPNTGIAFTIHIDKIVF